MMAEITVERTFKGQLGTGIAALLASFVLSLVLWPIWSTVMKAIFSTFASQGLTAAGPKVAVQLIGTMVEGSFFWMVINTWIWQTLVMGGYGKTKFTDKQPWAGLWYVLVAWFFGIVAFIVLIGFIGIWWKPFNLALMFMPQNNLGMGFTTMGILAGQFALLMTFLIFNTYFDKWPLVRKYDSIVTIPCQNHKIS